MKKILLGLAFLCLQHVSSFAQANCPSSQILRYEDGSTGCMTDNKIFSIQRNFKAGRLSIIDSLGTHERYLIAMTRNPKSCPINFLSVDWGGRNMPQSNTLNKCEDGIAERAARQNKSPAGCDCEIVFDSTRSKNITLSKANFELKSRAWLAGIQNSDQF